tara:strand:- start:1737 stop:2567 length:831 start_codon:yes stop_codon:yes gene_type:complete
MSENKKTSTEWNTEIESVSASTWQYIKKHYLKRTIFVIAGAVILTAAFIYGSILNYFDFRIAVIPPIILIVAYGLIQNKIHRIFMQQFAGANGFTYKKTIPWQDETGAIFRRGNSKKIYNVVEGNFERHALRLFNYRYTIRQGKHSTTYHFTIFSTKLSKHLPNMYLDAHGKRDRKAPYWAKKNLKYLSLEANEFNDNYSLYITEGQHVPALQIFTPDIMAELIDLTEYFDIEFINDTLYIYEEGAITTKRKLEEMHKIAKHLTENVAYIVDRMSV